ncbi:MAG: hypothetical protein NT079_03760, partial [Candidatus Omnitrophica bacterium]|nr:hypothetical protein [Candidatus Omnitrophota bacterium]
MKKIIIVCIVLCAFVSLSTIAFAQKTQEQTVTSSKAKDEAAKDKVSAPGAKTSEVAPKTEKTGQGTAAKVKPSAASSS